MLGHRHGPDIDQADVVFRFNDAPAGETAARNYTPFVGKKEGVRIVNNLFPKWWLENTTPLELRQGITYVVVPIMPKLKTPRGLDRLALRYAGMHIHALSPRVTRETMRALHDIYDDGWWTLREGVGYTPTSGALAMILAMSVCDRVKAYGYPGTSSAAAFPYHYYDSQSSGNAVGANWHKGFSAEKDLWRRLATNPAADVEATNVAVIPGFGELQCPDSDAKARSAKVAPPPAQNQFADVLLPAGLAGHRVGAFRALSLVHSAVSQRPSMQHAGEAVRQHHDATAAARWGVKWRGKGKRRGGMRVLAIVLTLLFPFAVGFLFVSWMQHRRRMERLSEATGRPMNLAASAASTALASYVVLLLCGDVIHGSMAASFGGDSRWDPCVVVLAVEVSKGLVSLALMLAASLRARSDLECSEPAASLLAPEPSAALRLSCAARLLPVAALYAGNSCLVLFVLGSLQFSYLVVWRNASIVFTTLLWTVCFDRTSHYCKLLGIGYFFVASLLMNIQVDGSWTRLSWLAILVLGSSLLSSAAAVANESVLKAPRFISALGLDQINLLLYVETSCILLGVIAGQRTRSGGMSAELLVGFDASTITFVVVQAAFGLVVSRVLVYADSPAKAMLGGVREVVVLLVAPFFVTSRCDWISISAGLWAVLAMTTYFMAPTSKASGTAKTMGNPVLRAEEARL